MKMCPAYTRRRPYSVEGHWFSLISFLKVITEKRDERKSHVCPLVISLDCVLPLVLNENVPGVYPAYTLFWWRSLIFIDFVSESHHREGGWTQISCMSIGYSIGSCASLVLNENVPGVYPAYTLSDWVSLSATKFFLKVITEKRAEHNFSSVWRVPKTVRGTFGVYLGVYPANAIYIYIYIYGVYPGV